jgi:hypothetical protein
MRILAGALLAAVAASSQTTARPAPPAPGPVGSMSDLMVKMIYPASDAIFYITTRTPTTEAEWGELQAKALTLAESANLLMMPGRARDEERWMQDAGLMLDAGRAAYRAARAKDVNTLDALSDRLYESCTSCHQHYRPNYGRRPAVSSLGTAAPSLPTLPNEPNPANPSDPRDPRRQSVAGATIEGRWRLRAAEDLRADGSVARFPWGEHPVGSIVVERGACYVQIMSSDTPSFAGTTPPGEQMKATLLSSYIAYSGPCVVDAAAGSVTLKVEAAWRPDYVGTEQKRYFRFDNGVLLFGPAPSSIRTGNETLTRRLTLDRVQ